MDEDRIKAAARQVRGTIGQAIRKLAGETRAQADSAAENAIDERESTIGNTNETVCTRPLK